MELRVFLVRRTIKSVAGYGGERVLESSVVRR